MKLNSKRSRRKSQKTTCRLRNTLSGMVSEQIDAGSSCDLRVHTHCVCTRRSHDEPATLLTSVSAFSDSEQKYSVAKTIFADHSN